MTLYEGLSLLLGVAVLAAQFILARRIATVHILFNSRVDQLIAAAKEVSRLEGRAERDAEGKK